MKGIKDIEVEIEKLERKAKEEEERNMYSGRLVRMYLELDKLNLQLKTTREILNLIQDRREHLEKYGNKDVDVQIRAELLMIEDKIKGLESTKKRK